ncbi:AraC family transcriptional regulator [Olivibacter sitiensis]|uniref:AraC family transcriptional regulator n=1 Tax=Olivibacter sitiensis TaxID=376470 RepID=UPI000486D295|nr:AraC family transcriptional regulator [Olivibacter sitiensis]
MRPKFLKVATSTTESFSVRIDKQPQMNNIWHYHPEVELVYVSKGQGTQFIGDSTKNFRGGQLILLGAYLPHYWHFDLSQHPETDVKVIHFHPHFWGKDFLLLPENQAIYQLLLRAKRGLEIGGVSKTTCVNLINQMTECSSNRKIIYLLQLLTELSIEEQLDPICGAAFQPTLEKSEDKRISTIYEYSMAHFKEKIGIGEVADKVGLSPHSFCRYFKSRTGKTYTRFLLEIRIGHACNLLLSRELSIKEVGFESGFFNITSFHKIFKEIKGLSPLVYRNTYSSAY